MVCRIDDLIARLNAIKAEHGNLFVTVQYRDDGGEYHGREFIQNDDAWVACTDDSQEITSLESSYYDDDDNLKFLTKEEQELFDNGKLKTVVL